MTETRRFAISCRLTLATNKRGLGFGFRGSQCVTVNLRGQSIDSTMVVGQVVQPKKAGHVELKGLTNHVFGERWTNLFGFCRPPKRGVADLLIQQRLLAKLRWRGGGCLFNLKDLLAVFPPSLKGISENEPILGASFLCRIVANSAIFCQDPAE